MKYFSQWLSLMILPFLLVGCFWRTGHPAEQTFDDPQVVELAYAAKAGDTQKIDELLDQGVDINTVGRTGLNPLYWLFVMNEKSPEKRKSFRYLLEQGADPLQIHEPTQLSLFHTVARYETPYYLEAILETNPEIEVDFEAGDTSWDTPLLQALMAHRYENFEILLDHGADIEKRTYGGDTPLVMASGNATWKFAYLLLQRGADYTIGEGKVTGGNPRGVSKMVWIIENFTYYPEGPTKRDGIDYRQKVIDFLRGKGVEVDPWMPGDE